MRFVTFNVQSLRDLENKNGKYRGPFPELTFRSRWVEMAVFFLQLIERKKVNVFALQEVGAEGNKLITDYFDSIGYQTVVTQYCPDAEAFRFIFAFNPQKYELLSQDLVVYTKSGHFLLPEESKRLQALTKIKRELLTEEQKQEKEKLFNHNLFVEFEKSAQVLLLKDLETEELVKIYNTHPGLTNAHRLECMHILAQHISEDKKAGLNVTVAGDMNQFDQNINQPVVLMEQVNILINAGLTWVSQETLLNSGASASFMAYAFDIIRFLSNKSFALAALNLAELYDLQRLIGDYEVVSKIKSMQLIQDGYKQLSFSEEEVNEIKKLLKLVENGTDGQLAKTLSQKLVMSEKTCLFDLIDKARDLMSTLEKNGEDTSNDVELQKLYKQIREFLQTKQNELIAKNPDCGAGLSTVLDFIGVSGPMFQRNRHRVRPCTFFGGEIVYTDDNCLTRQEWQQRFVEHPPISDHMALILESDTDDEAVYPSITTTLTSR